MFCYWLFFQSWKLNTFTIFMLCIVITLQFGARVYSTHLDTDVMMILPNFFAYFIFYLMHFTFIFDVFPKKCWLFLIYFFLFIVAIVWFYFYLNLKWFVLMELISLYLLFSLCLLLLFCTDFCCWYPKMNIHF